MDATAKHDYSLKLEFNAENLRSLGALLAETGRKLDRVHELLAAIPPGDAQPGEMEDARHVLDRIGEEVAAGTAAILKASLTSTAVVTTAAAEPIPQGTSVLGSSYVRFDFDSSAAIQVLGVPGVIERDAALATRPVFQRRPGSATVMAQAPHVSLKTFYEPATYQQLDELIAFWNAAESAPTTLPPKETE